MFKEGNIIYFDPFYFKNGNTAKPKYFVVLKNNGTNNLLASLPSSQDFLPSKIIREHGCIDLEDINFNCFLISNKVPATKCGKSFNFNTFLYGHQIDDYEIANMNDLYRNEGTDYIIWGEMEDSLFQNLLNCFKNSKTVKRKYQRIL